MTSNIIYDGHARIVNNNKIC